MKVYGVEITPQQIKSAKDRMKQGFFTSGDIESALLKAGVPRATGYNLVAYRAADRIIQSARKGGSLAWNGKHWMWRN